MPVLDQSGPVPQRTLEPQILALQTLAQLALTLALARRPVVVRREAKPRNGKLYQRVIDTHSFGNGGAGSPNVYVRSINSI
jgi:hypothetical protein